MHHNINNDIPPEKRQLVKRAYFGWFYHICCLAYNAICMTGALVVAETLAGFFYALIALLAGFFVSFFVYWLFYSALRKSSAAFFMLWFILFVIQIAADVWFAIGIVDYGSAGFILMTKAFSDGKVALGIMYAINVGIWAGLAIYSVVLFWHGRKEYSYLGGNRAATREFGKGAVNVAYENRETIKQFAVDNKDTIKQVVVENKDTIVEFAKEHRQEITQAVVDNKDTVWENREVIASVFDAPPK